MASLNDAKIKAQKAQIAAFSKELTEARQSIADIQGELDACSSMNDRVNRNIDGANRDIETLKDVARFFRAQRDRIEAYLNATLDGIDRQTGADRVREVYDAAPRAESQLRTDRRPYSGEPNSPSVSAGQVDFASYRDAEPSSDWENL